jgi:hypothetical protein
VSSICIISDLSLIIKFIKRYYFNNVPSILKKFKNQENNQYNRFQFYNLHKSSIAKLMKNILGKIFKFTSITLPLIVKESFFNKFGESLNVEWLKTDDFYEAIFYLEDIEHIAHFDTSGKLLNLKKNLPIHTTPDHIKEKAAIHGELMNVIEISEEEIVGYELIIRDEALIRFSLLLNEKGGLIQKNKL